MEEKNKLIINNLPIDYYRVSLHDGITFTKENGDKVPYDFKIELGGVVENSSAYVGIGSGGSVNYKDF